MRAWKFWRLVILVALLAVLGWTLINRSPIGRSFSETATLKTPYKTEIEWAIRETATDIERMAAFAHKRDPRPLTSPLPSAPWDVESFSVLAATTFGDTTAASSGGGQTDFAPLLTAMDVRTFVEASGRLSEALNEIRDPRAHESAALVIGAFALRDAADQFTDVRWALNRMTAHLAVARMLRRGGAASVDGGIAEVIVSTLSNQQARAAGQLAVLGAVDSPGPLGAWVRALHMRITQDWRVLSAAATSTRLEKLEYFRARRATVRRRRAAEDLKTVNEEVAADFARLAQDGIVGVEDGHMFIAPALDLELGEAGDAYQRIQGRPMPASLPDALNHRASHLVDSKPNVLPWGAWAEFFQRHIAMNIGMVDSFYRYSLGAAGQADAAKAELDARLGQLTLFPVGTYRRTKGNNATEADQTYLPGVVALAEVAPELVSLRAWQFFELGSHYESVPKSMPPVQPWFAPASAALPFEAGVRHRAGLRISAEDFDRLIATAPTDTWLLVSAAESGAAGPVLSRARELLHSRHDFDLRAIDASLAAEKDEAARVELQRKGCNLSSRDCLVLASTLSWMAQEDEAAAIYERAFGDPMIDMVALSGDAGWLVDYYRRRLRIDDAVALAERAASVGSAPGYVTRGRLRESLGDLDGAEQDLSLVAERYNSREYLLGFYYRRVEVAHDERYRPKWAKWLAETFPNGLQAEPTSMTETPKTGVFINKDSERSRKAGIRAGDIVIGLEGWRVDTQEQYRAINQFFNHPRVKLTLWRGSLIKIEADSPNRLFGTELRTHPLKGWIE